MTNGRPIRNDGTGILQLRSLNRLRRHESTIALFECITRVFAVIYGYYRLLDYQRKYFIRI